MVPLLNQGGTTKRASLRPCPGAEGFFIFRMLKRFPLRSRSRNILDVAKGTPPVFSSPAASLADLFEHPASVRLEEGGDAMTRMIRIFDTTLRDGEQSPGASMNVEEKLMIAKQLARLGVDIIEAGFAYSSPGDFEAVRRIAQRS